MTRAVLVVGISGAIGNALGRHLAKQGWRVHGLARHPPQDIAGVQPVAAENIKVNATMVRNLLARRLVG